MNVVGAQMDQSVATFSYTANRRSFYGYVGAWAILFLVEGLVFAVLIIAIVPGVVLKTALLAALSAAILVTHVAVLLRPLWTRHRLTDTELLLRYGSDKLNVPRAEILAAEPVAASRRQGFVPGVQFDSRKRRITATFSDQGQVLLRLNRPHRFVMKGVNDPVKEILINVDHRDAFLTALGLPQMARDPEVATKPSPEDPPDPLPTTEIGSREPLARTGLRGRPSRAPLIRADRLTCRYGDHLAVDELVLAIHPGEIYGFLGPNGAGKTSTIKMLVGLLAPTSGRAITAGYDIEADPMAAKAAFGYVPDRAILYERLTGQEFLDFVAQLRGLPQTDAASRIRELLDLLDLTEHANVLCGKYSFGMKRKLAIAGALLHQPVALILDEPMNGLDPRSTRRLKDLLTQLANEGTAILLSTHDLAVAESFCHRVGILHQGRLVMEGSAEELRRIAAAPDLEAVFLALTVEGAPVS